ncbi:MAG: cytidylate kinase family protein [Candidatus Aenigmatarchaeota archaeon]|nr:cytidylate kinase family protein [Candidatus Aenigmarchaeota archaeon]
MVVIAISGLAGSGTSTLAKMLAEKLGLKYFSPGEYFKSHSSGRNETERVMDVFQSGKGLDKDFHKKIDEMQINLAKKGNIVICGKLSILMLKDIADYKIWIECDLEERARRTAKRDGIRFEDALKALKQREKLQLKEWKKDYGIDYTTQKKMADIVIDNTNLNERQVFEKVIELIKR